MNQEHFNSLVKNVLEICSNKMISKGEEYSLDIDRLSAFKNASLYLSESPISVLLNYRAKHEMSIIDICNKMTRGQSYQKVSKDLLYEKVTDNINYLILLLALVQDMGLYESEEPDQGVLVSTEEPDPNDLNTDR